MAGVAAYDADRCSFGWHCTCCICVEVLAGQAAALLSEPPTPSHIFLTSASLVLAASRTATFVPSVRLTASTRYRVTLQAEGALL